MNNVENLVVNINFLPLAAPSEERVDQENGAIDDGQRSLGEPVVPVLALPLILEELNVQGASSYESRATDQAVEDVDPSRDRRRHQVA